MIYDPEKVSYSQLLKYFWEKHATPLNLLTPSHIATRLEAIALRLEHCCYVGQRKNKQLLVTSSKNAASSDALCSSDLAVTSYHIFSLSTGNSWTLLGAPGLTTSNKDATRNKGHRY